MRLFSFVLSPLVHRTSYIVHRTSYIVHLSFVHDFILPLSAKRRKRQAVSLVRQPERVGRS